MQLICIVQAAYLFTSNRWVHQRTVIAIAASGDYWSYSVVDKGSIISQREGDEEVMDWVPDMERTELIHSRWVPEMRYGSKESAEAESTVKLLMDKLFLN